MNEIVFDEFMDGFASDYDIDELYNRFKEILFSNFDGDLYAMFLFPDEEIRAFVYFVAWYSTMKHMEVDFCTGSVFSK